MKATEIAIIDYGMGNIGSIQNMLRYLNHPSIVTNSPEDIQAAGKIILPGVGSFDNAIENIKQLGIYELLKTKALVTKTPMMGICLGMQIMCKSSEEGITEGLSLVDAEVKRFDFERSSALKVPHMGWNNIEIINKKSRLMHGLDNNSRFYFVHSYYVTCNDSSDILTHTNYGVDFVSSFERGNILGVQFHPEKSHKFGIRLFKNFILNY